MDAYPLAWPAGWPRHKGEQDSDSRFKGPTYQWDRVFRGLQDELRRIGATMGNMRSLTISIEGLRQMERHGGATMMERAFDGFAALPPPEDCWKILGFEDDNRGRWSRDEIMAQFRAAARDAHGTGADMDRIVKARDEALRSIA